MVDHTEKCHGPGLAMQPRDLIVVWRRAGGKSMYCPTAGAQSLSVSKHIERDG